MCIRDRPDPEVEQVAERAPAPEEREGRGEQDHRDPLDVPAELGEPLSRQALEANVRGERAERGGAGERQRERDQQPPPAPRLRWRVPRREKPVSYTHL